MRIQVTILLMFLIVSCTDNYGDTNSNDDTVINTASIDNSNTIFDEVNIEDDFLLETKSNPIVFNKINPLITYDDNQDRIEIKHKNTTIYIHLVDTESYLTLIMNGNVVNEGLSTQFDYFYSEDLKGALNRTKLFTADNIDEEILIFPVGTEEYPQYNALIFDDTGFLHTYEFVINEWDCAEIKSITLNTQADGDANAIGVTDNTNKACSTRTYMIDDEYIQEEPELLSSTDIAENYDENEYKTYNFDVDDENKRSYFISPKRITYNPELYEYEVSFDETSILIKLTDYHTYVSFKKADSYKNKYLPIYLNIPSDRSPEHMDSITKVFKQSSSDEGAFVFEGNPATYPLYTALLFNNSGIYHTYDFEVLEPECTNFDLIQFSDIPYKRIAISQQGIECDARLTNHSLIDEIVNSEDSNSTHSSPLWNGVYEYSTYQTIESKGIAFGEIYTIRIDDNHCFIDIGGYQVDKHFECYINIINDVSIEVYDLEKNKKFGTTRRDNDEKLIIDMSYYMESDNFSHDIEKVD